MFGLGIADYREPKGLRFSETRSAPLKSDFHFRRFDFRLEGICLALETKNLFPIPFSLADVFDFICVCTIGRCDSIRLITFQSLNFRPHINAFVRTYGEVYCGVILWL